MQIVPVKISLDPDTEIPEYATTQSSGFDLKAKEDVLVPSNQHRGIPTGVRVEIPPGMEVQVRSKSGLALKQGLFVLNSPGTIDSDYRGEIVIILYNTSDKAYQVHKGDKVAQGVLCPVYQCGFIEVSSLSETARGEKGFGSTGI